MLTSDQERALERFSLECDGRSVTVRQFENGVAVLKCGRAKRLVGENGIPTRLSRRAAHYLRADSFVIVDDTLIAVDDVQDIRGQLWVVGHRDEPFETDVLLKLNPDEPIEMTVVS